MKKVPKIAIISDIENTISDFLCSATNINGEFLSLQKAKETCFDKYDAFCILGGTKKAPLSLPPDIRLKIEEQIKKGKKAFFEYCISILDTYADKKTVKTHTRLSYLGDDYKGLKKYDVLDDQQNHALSYHFSYEDSVPLMVYRDFIMAHSNLEAPLNEGDKVTNYGLWLLKPNVMVCSFRLSNFVKARFTPIYKWQYLIEYCTQWLSGVLPSPINFPSLYELNISDEPFEPKIKSAVEKAINWYESSSLLLENGKAGIKEGFSHVVDGDGIVEVSDIIRADCCGESSLAFYTQYKLTGDLDAKTTFLNLSDYVFEGLQIHGGVFDGMVRWSDMAWTVCYQDDVARAIMPALLYTLYENDMRYEDSIKRALNFLIKTTPSDGIRPNRTDLILTDKSDESEALEKLKSQNGVMKSAHYNAYYHAVLLMGYKIWGIEEYKTLGVKGLETIMEIYPDTVREQSETEELCRLVLPLAWLFHITNDNSHKDMLYTVIKDLQRLKTKDGAYLEWDTGYTANCSKTNNTESSLLANNGDPICDFLYSMNWLPLGFSQAYMITKDPYIKELWEETALFFANCQIASSDPRLDGSWARGFDPKIREYCGMPHDVGWGPWAIETGWTVGEISSGLGLGLLAEELSEHYK